MSTSQSHSVAHPQQQQQQQPNDDGIIISTSEQNHVSTNPSHPRSATEALPNEPLVPKTSSARAAARFQASAPIRFVKKLGHNAINKVEDLGVGLVGVTEGIAGAGGELGQNAVSGVGAVGSAVESGVSSALGPSRQKTKIISAREVDTITEVDISGTILKDLNREIEVEKMKGTSNTESPLNTPWILLIFPIFPIAFMYTKTAMGIFLPPTLNFVFSVWTFFGWRFWFCLVLLIGLVIIVAWEAIKAIEPLRFLTLQVDVAAIKVRRKVAKHAKRQLPKIFKALDRIFPPVTAALIALDKLLTPKLGYSPLLAINARINGWIYDPKIKEIAIEEDPRVATSRGTVQSDYGSDYQARESLTGNSVIIQKRDRGHAVVMSEEGNVMEQGVGGLEFDQDRVSERVKPMQNGAGDIFEQFFAVKICLKELSELHRSYTSVWVEWMYRGMVVDRSVIRDITTSEDWKGFGTSFDDYELKGEVRLPYRADTTEVAGGYYDIPIKLVLKGRDGLPIYANDGARRYMRDSPPVNVIGKIELSALRIGVGADSTGVIRSELRVPLHALGVEQYRAAILSASAKISPVDNSSYSYRQMLSKLPSGEWTVRVNVFELRNLKGVDNSGSSDPFVQASVMGMVKKTDRQKQTLSCMVNQLLFFSKLCTGLEFEDQKIVIDVMDWNRIAAAKKIGVYTLDAKRILELPGRELFRKWFALQDPNGGKRPAGFIKMSITVVPPGEIPPHHQETEDSEEFSTANLLKNTVLKTPKMSYQNWAVHVTVGWADMLPRMSTAGYRDAIRGYIKYDYSGWDETMSNTYIAEAKEVIDSNIGNSCRVLDQRRVIWNQEYILPLTIINDRVAQEGINLKLFHKIMPRLNEPTRTDQLIGQVSVSFEELFKNMTNAVVRGDPADGEDEGDRVREVAMMKPRYYNFYGMPDAKSDPYDKGVAFRGRVLIGVAAKPGDVAKPFLRPCPPPPRPKLEFYKMTFCVLRATELPLADGWTVYIECRIGLYQFGHTIPKAVATNSCAEWDENCAVSVPNMQFPDDVEQIPDFFVTIWGRKPATVEELEEKMADGSKSMPAQRQAKEETDQDAWNPDGVDEGTVNDSGATMGPMDNNGGSTDDGQWQPKAFLRLPAQHLICAQQDPRWMFMDYPGNDVLDSNDNQVPGSILMSASLSRCDPTKEDYVPPDEGSGVVSSFSATLHNGDRTLPIENSPGGVHDEIQPDSISLKPNASEGLPVQPMVLANGGLEHLEAQGKSNSFSYPLGMERSYTLRAIIFRGKDLPAADKSGLSDPVVKLSMGDQRKEGQIICKQTVAPIWEEMIEVRNIRIRDGERKPNVNVLIYDHDADENEKSWDYLGRTIIPCADLDTAVPSLEHAEWYPVFSVNPGLIVGEILADFQVIPSVVAENHPMPPLPEVPRSSCALRISLVGLRDVKFLQYAAGEMFVNCSVSNDSMQPEPSKTGTILQQRAYEANCNILDVLLMNIDIPEDLRLSPALSLFAYANYHYTVTADLVATACIPLEKWLHEHNRRLVTGESLTDDSFGMDTPVPKRLYESEYGYKFRRNIKRAGEEPIGAASLRLHEVKATERGEKKSLSTQEEKNDVLQIGFTPQLLDQIMKRANNETGQKSAGVAEKIAAMLAPIRAVKYSIADTLADIMPDVTSALGIEVEEDISITSLLTKDKDDDKIDYDGTMFIKRERGSCPYELESDFSEPAYGEFLMFRGDNRSLGNTIGKIKDAGPAGGNQAFPPVLPLDEVSSTTALINREKRRATLEGSRLAVGKVKARLDLIEMDPSDDIEAKKVRMTSLRSFGRIFMPTEVVVRVYVLRAVDLQQIGSQCNPYISIRFYGGYPDSYSRKHEPVMDDDNPNFFRMFESRVKMPGGSVRIELKDRILPELNVPLSYPMYIREEGRARMGFVQKDIPVNVGKLGLGWSETIGETVIDLDARWYNSAWRSLAKTPVERRALFSEDSANLKGQLEMFVDIFDAAEVDKRPKLYRQIPISAPPQESYVVRVVIYKIKECLLPYKLANNDPAKLAAFYIQARLGNLAKHSHTTDRCRHVTDGVAEFNWRMKWNISLPSLDIKPRLKLQIFDDTSHGFGDDQLCATADIKLRSLFDDICVNRKPIIKKKQWISMEHPNHPDVQAQMQMSLELTTAEMAKKKKCFSGRNGWKDTQHQDYILPIPFQPAAFSLYNPVPYFNYVIVSMVKNLQWQLATILLIFPFIPMFVQFVFMVTPWQWYAAGGTCGLLVFVRLLLVNAAKTARMQAELDAAKEVDDDDDGDDD